MDMDIEKLLSSLVTTHKQIEKLQKSLELTGESVGGLVKVEMTGHCKVNKILIDDNLRLGNVSFLENLVAAAVNDALSKLDQCTLDCFDKNPYKKIFASVFK